MPFQNLDLTSASVQMKGTWAIDMKQELDSGAEAPGLSHLLQSSRPELCLSMRPSVCTTQTSGGGKGVNSIICKIMYAITNLTLVPCLFAVVCISLSVTAVALFINGQVCEATGCCYHQMSLMMTMRLGLMMVTIDEEPDGTDATSGGLVLMDWALPLLCIFSATECSTAGAYIS